MAAPRIFVRGYTALKLSGVPGLDRITVHFSADQDLDYWEARAGGNGVGTGLLVGQSAPDPWPRTFNEIDNLHRSFDQVDALHTQFDDLDNRTTLKAGAIAQFEVEATELNAGDGEYQISIYGRNAAGEVTPYQSLNMLTYDERDALGWTYDQRDALQLTWDQYEVYTP